MAPSSWAFYEVFVLAGEFWSASSVALSAVFSTSIRSQAGLAIACGSRVCAGLFSTPLRPLHHHHPVIMSATVTARPIQVRNCV